MSALGTPSLSAYVNAIKGHTLTPTDVEVMLAYVNKADSLTANQKRVWRAVLESHERLRVEKLLVNLI